MTEENFMTFEEFKKPVVEDNKTDEEILTDVKDIIATFNKEVR